MSDQDILIKEIIQEIGEISFPDDNVTWNIETIEHKGKYSSVVTCPTPPTVGYEKLRFIILFHDEHSYRVVGCYCYDIDRWTLLFTDPSADTQWRELF